MISRPMILRLLVRLTLCALFFLCLPSVVVAQDVKEQKNELVKKAIVPDIALGAHTASLGLVFYDGSAFPQKYRGGLFIGQHGSWNRSVLSGYKVVFIPFRNGIPSDKPEDFLTGFIADASKKQVHGRPVNLAVLRNGAMLLADDSGNTIWMITANKSLQQ